MKIARTIHVVMTVISSLIFSHSYSQLSYDFEQLDSMVLDAIDSSYFPGAQVLVAKDSQVLFHKAFGYHTYDKQTQVQLDHLYDLASITKVIAGLPILMQLQSIGKFDVNKTLGSYASFARGSTKESIPVRPILAHQAGLHPYFVFWKEAQKHDGSYKRRSFKKKRSRRYPIKITDSLYLHRKYEKKMIERIIDSPLDTTKTYKYSGLFFIMIPQLIQDITGVELDVYLSEYFLTPMGISRLCYNPLQSFSKEEIVPTEEDTLFRNQKVHGTVHDETAAMLAGISGNAGLFGNAYSLFTFFQMYLNGGELRGHKYIRKDVVDEYTSYQYQDNRRGLGFDKPPRKWDNTSYIAQSASHLSYGHSGFTGTFVWADPQNDILVILLTNRVFPTRASRGIYTSNFRPRFHQLAYDILLE